MGGVGVGGEELTCWVCGPIAVPLNQLQKVKTMVLILIITEGHSPEHSGHMNIDTLPSLTQQTAESAVIIPTMHGTSFCSLSTI